MRYGPAAAVSTCLLLVSSLTAAQEGPVSDRVAIRESERALADATHARDRQRLEELLGVDYVLRGAPDIDRDTWIRNAVTMCWGDRSDIDGFRARVHGDVAVASFELTFYVDPSTCRPAVLRSLITDVWVRDPGGWRLQIRHSAAPPDPKAGIAAQYGILPELPPTWDLSGELSLVSTGGNTSTRTLGLGGNVAHLTGRRSTRASIAFVTSEADDVTQARSLTMQVRQAFRVGERVELFGRGSYARDRFAGIDHRAITEGGVAYTASLPGRHTITAEGSVGFTGEQRLEPTDLQFASGTGAVRYRWRILPGAEFTQDAGLTTDLAAARNWRGSSATAFSVALTQILSLKALHAMEYRNIPVAGFGRADMQTSAALVFSWQRRPRVR